MINFISLSVKCPLCGKSLMDKEHKVDNEPGIKMAVEAEQGRGIMIMSSIYGSHNYITDVIFGDQEVVTFSCPHCTGKLSKNDACELCGAPMVPLILKMGGKVSFCSRKGCQNHNVEFNDLADALKRFYEEYGIKVYNATPEHIHLRKEQHPAEDTDDHKEIIRNGSFLRAYCPHCRKSLIEDDMLKLKVIRKGVNPGYIFLSPYLNVFSSKSTVFLPEEEILGDVRCFHCDKSLLVENKKCDRCGTAIAKIIVSARTKMIDFYICSRKGCTWHGLNEEDMNDIRMEDSIEW